MQDKFLRYSFLIVFFIFLIYLTVLIVLTWPISELSIGKSGVFGDSFGALTALFTGLAFAGTLRTIQMQNEELSLQRQEIRQNRYEFERTASAQEKTVRLTAITILIAEYDLKHNFNKEKIMRLNQQLVSGITTESIRVTYLNELNQLEQENESICSKKRMLVNELEAAVLGT